MKKKFPLISYTVSIQRNYLELRLFNGFVISIVVIEEVDQFGYYQPGNLFRVSVSQAVRSWFFSV